MNPSFERQKPLPTTPASRFELVRAAICSVCEASLQRFNPIATRGVDPLIANFRQTLLRAVGSLKVLIE
jgi:hypothetical protein